MEDGRRKRKIGNGVPSVVRIHEGERRRRETLRRGAL